MRIALAFLVLAGCAASTGPNATAEKAPPAAPGPQPVQTADSYRVAIERNEAPFREPGANFAQLGQDTRMDGFTVSPLEVIEDSRCPVDTTCVWAGRVRLRVRITGRGGDSGEGVLELDRPMAVRAESGRIELASPHQLPGAQQLTLVAVAPLNWARPPAGVDPNAPKRFAFTLID